MESELANIKLRLPRWLMGIYALFAVILVPWIIFLAYSLPARHVSRHWDLAWVGFDMALLAALGLTAYLGARRSGWITMGAITLATLLVVDAWFDVLTARPGRQTQIALVMALLIELPLAVMSFRLAQKVARQLVAASRRS